MKLSIEQQEAQVILNYLQERPFKEVAGLIQILLKLPPIEEGKEPEKVPDIEEK